MMLRYENYVESGSDWLGLIPAHWSATKLKWISAIYAGGTPSTGVDEYWENGTVPWLNSGSVNQRRITTAPEYITEEAVLKSSTKWVPKGALVMALAGQGKTKGMVAIMEIEATCNQSMAAIVPDTNKLCHEFLFYWLDCNYLRIRGLAGTELRDGLNLEIVGGITCPLPPLTEQEQIAVFLNRQTELIEQIIKQKGKSVELLEEKRRSLINEVVTQGLVTQIKGNGAKGIPVDWRIKPLKYLASLKGRLGWKGLTADEYVESGYGFLSTPDIKSNLIDFKSIKFITQERYIESPEIMLEVGDVLLVKDGSTLGIVNLIKELPIPSTVNSSIAVIRVYDTEVLMPQYLFWFLRSDHIQNEVTRLKAGQGVPHLFQKDIKNLEIFVPPLNVQKAIVNHITDKDNILKAIIAGIEAQIDKLKELKLSLITEVISGKLNVCEIVPKIVS